MITFERRQRLLQILSDNPGLRVPEIAQRLNVSEGTIRNDLQALSDTGQLTRVRGGAVLAEQTTPNPLNFATRASSQEKAKTCIARLAAGLVEDGDSLILDASTTVYYLAGFLKSRQGLTVITNGIETARVLAQNASNHVLLVGGLLKADGTSITGTLGEQFLKDIFARKAFVSCSGFTPEVGLTEVDIQEVQLKRIMIASASSVFALIDSSKFGRIDLTPFARTEQIKQIFTDCDLSPSWVERLEQAGIIYTLCSESGTANPS